MPRFLQTRLLLAAACVFALLALTACEAESEPMDDDAAAVVPADEVESAPADEAPATKINLNTATEEAFRTIPGIGDRMIHEFEEYRPYVSIRQFRREIGKYVDAEQVAAYEQYVFVPIHPNESDAETIAQLPGVDAEFAERLIAGRPYASKEAFLQVLSDHLSAAEQVRAFAYVTDL